MLDTHTPLRTATEAVPDAVAPPARRRRLWLLLSLVAVVAAALGVGGWWYMTAGPGAYTTVPGGLLGSRLTDAQATLTEAGLVGTTVEAFDPTEPSGEVLGVSPVGDTRILKDGTVTLTVSKGPDLRDVSVEPAGQTLEAVQAALTTAGFEVLPEHVYSDTVPAGTVISAVDEDGVPVEVGLKLPVGMMITLTCSDGLQPVTIPAVVGMTRDAAVAALGELGLAVTESQAYSSEVAPGIVKLQSPEAGAAGYRLDTVAIVVSLGPEPPPPPKPAPAVGGVQVPNLVGMYKYPAWSKISDLGFTGEHVDSGCTRLGELGYEHCVVESQSPAAGTRKPAGSLITIYLRDE